MKCTAMTPQGVGISTEFNNGKHPGSNQSVISTMTGVPHLRFSSWQINHYLSMISLLYSCRGITGLSLAGELVFLPGFWKCRECWTVSKGNRQIYLGQLHGRLEFFFFFSAQTVFSRCRQHFPSPGSELYEASKKRKKSKGQ